MFRADLLASPRNDDQNDSPPNYLKQPRFRGRCIVAGFRLYLHQA